METTVEGEPEIGRAKTVLVFGNGPKACALITALVAQTVGSHSKPRLRFRGPVRFSSQSLTHVQTVVLPLVDRVCQLLGLVPGAFDISGVNLGAASSQDLGLDISGFSADLPLFLALLSARLQIPLPQDVLSTGHIASTDGEIRLVQNLPLKLEACRTDKSIARFIYPALDADPSIAALTPAQFAHVRDALATGVGSPKPMAVADVAELLQLVVPEEAAVLASLIGRYLGRSLTKLPASGPVRRAVHFLGANTKRRYFEALKSRLSAGQSEAAVLLLETWAEFWVEARRYPSGFGKRLRRILLAVPPSVRLRTLQFPLLPVSWCIKLSQCASDQDQDDVVELYACVCGRAVAPSTDPLATRSNTPHPSETSALAVVLSEISQEHLALAVCHPIDAARASFLIDSVTVDNAAQTIEVVTSFYIHLLQHTQHASECLTIAQAGPEAHDLLEHAFARQGGSCAAFAEAQTGIQGGLRFVLDSMTEQFKRDALAKHITQVLTTAIDPLDWPARVRFVQDFLRHCPDAVPADLRDAPPERFARNWEPLVRAYSHGLDEVRQLLRSM